MRLIMRINVESGENRVCMKFLRFGVKMGIGTVLSEFYHRECRM